MIGQTISHYKIIDRLGEGGMGVVYKAHDTKLDRIVALKFLPPHITKSEEDKQRFIREAKAAAALNHPHICTVYSVEEHEGSQFISMEYIDGVTLRQRSETMANDNRQLATSIAYAIQIAEALSEAHDKGIVHRDIKPENIMVDAKNRIKVMDFGLAKMKGGIGITNTAITVGTAAYMSPEQIRSEEVDHRTDIWSLGVTIYELLTGRLPFRGEHQAAMVYSITNEDPQPVTSFRSDVPQYLQMIIEKALEKEGDRRYQNIEEFLSDLKQTPTTTETEKRDQKSIAVLPFENISPDNENEFFSDGLTEEIIATLSKINNLDVISRTSIMRYKGTTKPIKEIANELQVEFLLEGSVRKHGNNLRITAQLIDAKRDAHIWVEKYRGDMDDIFDIQENVAGEIAQALEFQLTPHEKQDLQKRGTENPEAYQLYLKGRYYWNLRSEAGLKKSIEFFKRAIEKDPLYALAYHGLADVHNILGFYTFVSPAESFPRARAAAEKALERDDTIAEAYSSLAYTMHYYYWNWNDAEQNYKRSIELKSNYATVHHFYGNFLISMGRFKEAIAAFKRAEEIDPLSMIAGAATGWAYNFAQQYDNAIKQLKKTIDLDDTFALAYLFLGVSYKRTSRYEEAIAEVNRAVELSERSVISLAELAHLYAVSGMKNDAKKIINELDERAPRNYVSPYYRSVIHAGLGETDRAIEWLQEAVDERSHWVTFLNVDPDLDPLRSDPHFNQIVEQVGLRYQVNNVVDYIEKRKEIFRITVSREES